MKFLVIIFLVEFFMNIVAVVISFGVFSRIFHVQYQKVYLLIGGLGILHMGARFLSSIFTGFLVSSFSFFEKILGKFLAYEFIHILTAIIICGIIDGIVLTQVPFFHVEHIDYSIREPVVMGLMNAIVLLGNILLFYIIAQNIANDIVFL
ncbi:MAG: hypothetical protein GY801_11755 [bacterium]|nr:hypothetical protein [bacterium]